MYRRCSVIVLIFSVLGMTGSIGFAAPPQMRPYSGIGLVVFSSADSPKKQSLQLQLYEEPGLSRIELLNDSALSGNEWIFGSQNGGTPLIVSARKGGWFRVFFDDAGREAWINPQDKGYFKSWEQYLKQHTGRMLPALQQKYYQLLQKPDGKQIATLTPRQVFKFLKLNNSWGMVLTDKGQLGWLRWRDSDGRLTVGTDKN